MYSIWSYVLEGATQFSSLSMGLSERIPLKILDIKFLVTFLIGYRENQIN